MIFLGTSACVQLNQFEEAIMWCDKGLAVSFIADNKTLTKNIVPIYFLSFILICTTSSKTNYKK